MVDVWGGLADFVERKSRLTIVKRLHGRGSQSMTQAVLELANQLQDKLKTLTVDHGKEFAGSGANFPR